MTLDFRGTAPQFMNRSSIRISPRSKRAVHRLLQTSAGLAASMRIVADRDHYRSKFISTRKARCRSHESDAFVQGCVVWTIPMNKFNYSLPTATQRSLHRSTIKRRRSFTGSDAAWRCYRNFCATSTQRPGRAQRGGNTRFHRCSASCAIAASTRSARKTPIIVSVRTFAKDRIGWANTVQEWLRTNRDGARFRLGAS